MTARRTVLDPRAADRIVKLLGMLGSDHDGERAAAGAAAHRLLRQLGLTWGDIIAVPAPPTMPDNDDDWRRLVRACLAHADLLSNRELEFLKSMRRWRGEPSEKQVRWVLAIFQRVSV
jgi:hypothetical protein